MAYYTRAKQIIERYKNLEEVDTFNLNKVCISGGYPGGAGGNESHEGLHGKSHGPRGLMAW